MKMNDYEKQENCLRKAFEVLMEAYETVDTSEDESWSNEYSKVIEEIHSLEEQMIFTFRIED